jgi:hypothetical protein
LKNRVIFKDVVNHYQAGCDTRSGVSESPVALRGLSVSLMRRPCGTIEYNPRDQWLLNSVSPKTSSRGTRSVTVHSVVCFAE